MARRVHDLVPSNLDALPEGCRSCVFWEVAGAQRGPRVDRADLAASSKEAWWQATQLEWGTPGKVLYDGDRAVGYAMFAPAEYFPRVRHLRAGVSDDALLLAALWVAPGHRGAGLSKILLQSVLREAYRRGCRAVEAYGARRLGGGDVLATCVVGEGFLRANGFQVLHDDPEMPLLRLDLRQTVRWQESVGHALEGVLSALNRRERAPAPTRPALQARR